MKKITIVIVDDHKLIRDSWALILSMDEHFHVISQTGDAQEAINIVQSQHPDIVLLDINMRPVNGFEILQQIKRSASCSKAIIVSMMILPAYVKKAMREGACGYLSKNSETKELIRAVKEVYHGNTYISEDLRTLIANQWTHEVLDKGHIATLSVRELEIVNLIQEGFSSRQIGERLNINNKTVEVHRYNILKKLKVSNTAALINLITTQGL